jgi:MoxR-like ATPase
MALLNLLRAALFCPGPDGFWGRPLILWGDPGTGKTSVVAALARACGLAYERLSPAERGEGQFGVVPVPGTDGRLHYPAPAWADRFTQGGLLFVDEINTAAPALQAPLLGLVQLRTLGEHVFPNRTRVLAAANETQDAAGGWDLAPALANRFGHFDFEGLSSADWTVGFLGGFSAEQEIPLNPVAEEERVMAAWPGADAAARGMVAGFIQRRPALLHCKPDRNAGASSRAWPSRRSVENAAVMLASAKVHGLNESETDELVAAFVGNAWVAEFATWRATADLPNPEDVLDGKVPWAHDPRRLDRTLAVLAGCAAVVAPAAAAKRAERSVVAWKLIGGVLNDAADVAIPAARVLLKARLQPAESRPILAKILPMLQAAGL